MKNVNRRIEEVTDELMEKVEGIEYLEFEDYDVDFHELKFFGVSEDDEELNIVVNQFNYVEINGEDVDFNLQVSF